MLEPLTVTWKPDNHMPSEAQHAKQIEKDQSNKPARVCLCRMLRPAWRPNPVRGGARAGRPAGENARPAAIAACCASERTWTGSPWRVARRAPGGPPKAEPGADAGPVAPQAPP
jgi:hypothetical protein